MKEHDMFKNKETEKIIDIQYTSDSVIPNLKPLAVWHLTVKEIQHNSG